MKILLLADVESKYLWDYFEKEKLDGIDLIISCGDLKAEYLSFLATFTTAPVLYVHGNHDVKYDYKAPDALDVLKRFLTATAPYINAGVSIGGDLGVDYSDVLRILDELGIGIPQTKAMKEDPDIHQGIVNHDRAEKELTYDGFKMYDMITGYGVAAAADEAWKLKGGKEGASVVIQGFGCVGASCVNSLYNMGYKVVGISDVNGLVYCKDGLNIPKLF